MPKRLHVTSVISMFSVYVVVAYRKDDGDNINLKFRSIVSSQWSLRIIRASIRQIIRMDSFLSLFRTFMDPSEQMANK